MIKTNSKKMSHRRRAQSGTTKQTDFSKPSGDSYTVSELDVAFTKFYGKVDAQFIEDFYLNVECSPTTGILKLNYHQIVDQDGPDFVTLFSHYGLLLLNYYKFQNGIDENANSEVDLVQFAECIINLRAVVSKQIWVFLVYYAFFVVIRLRDSTARIASELLMNC